MELAPRYRAELHRQQAEASLALAMKAQSERSLALLIDTAIESCQQARAARRQKEEEARQPS